MGKVNKYTIMIN